MQKPPDFGAALAAAVTDVVNRLVQFLPSIVGAALLLLAGWLLARLLRAGAVRLMSLLDLLLARISRSRGAEPARLPVASVEVVAGVLFWVVMLFFIAAATQVLGLGVFTAWLEQVVAYLPTLLAGALIVLAGVLVSGLTRDLVLAAMSAAPEVQRLLLARLAQGAILVTAIVVGADQIGIRITFLVIMAAVVAAAVVGGVALALSLGARTWISNLIGAHYLRQSFAVGQTVRVSGFEGRILDFTPVSVVLETADGRLTLPAKVFHEQAIELVVPRDAGR